ncbi:hypothetical protein EON83_28940 [bacterium]|nr:MAG: hypothetical protein EON83_28940 [bacterium]
MKKKPVYVIAVVPYSENIGGVMMLYKLCDMLRKSGKEAYIWSLMQPVSPRFPLLYWYIGYFKRMYLKIRGQDPMALTSDFDAPVAPFGVLKDAIVVYPEVVAGNPFQARHVVRWFLNKPGRLTGRVEYGQNELYFYYQEVFNDYALNPYKENKLTIIHVLNDIYKQVNFGERKGVCYILRKGRARVGDMVALNGVVIDGKSHEEVAKIFNECEYCVAYDLYSMYSAYAVMCGCKSIVMPEPGLEKQRWQPVESFTHGIAYGKSDLLYALKTAPQLIEHYQNLERDSKASLASFVQKCEEFFPD